MTDPSGIPVQCPECGYQTRQFGDDALICPNCGREEADEVYEIGSVEPVEKVPTYYGPLLRPIEEADVDG